MLDAAPQGGHSDSLDPSTVQRTRAPTEVHTAVNPLETATLQSIAALPEAERALYKKEWEYCRVAGLGFLPFFMCPHHDRAQSNGQARATSFDAMLGVNGAEVGLGVDNNAAVVVDGDRWRIISDGGSVTKKVFLNGRLHATVLPPNGDWQPMDVLLERPDFTSLPPSPYNGEGIVGSGLTRAQHELIRGLDTLPPLRQQAVERAEWIAQRESQVLPALMAEAGVEFWLIANKEYGEVRHIKALLLCFHPLARANKTWTNLLSGYRLPLDLAGQPGQRPPPHDRRLPPGDVCRRGAERFTPRLCRLAIPAATGLLFRW